MLRGSVWAFLAAAFLIATAHAAEPAPGVTADRILFGQSAAFSGPAGALGTALRRGLRAAFAEVDRAGGIGGRRLDLVAYDDQYEPERTIANVRRLLDEDRVFALVGEVGTPTSLAVEPIARAAGVPFLGPVTGASALRAPERATTIHLRASYARETEEMVEHLTTDLGFTRIAVLYQDDSFGKEGLDGVHQALERRAMKTVSEGNYPRSTTAVKAALLDIRSAEPQAVIIVGSYGPSAMFIKWARKLGMECVFVSTSFVGSSRLAAELGPDGSGVMVTQVVPFPWDASLPVVAQFQAALAASEPDAEPGFLELEGYLVGRLVAALAARAGPQPTRESFLGAVRTMSAFDLGGVQLVYGPGDGEGSDRVYLTMIGPDGRYVAIDRMSPP